MRVISQGERLEIQTNASPLWCWRSISPLTRGDVTESASIPRPGSCLIARVIHGKWLLNKFTTRGDGGVVTFSTTEGRHFVEMELSDDETVAFDIEFLVGFSGLKKLQTCIGLSVPAIMAGKVFIQYATGPGRLYFRADGPPVLTSDTAARFDSHRMIAWKRGTTFTYGGLEKYRDLFLNDARLAIAEVSEPSWVLLNGDRQSEGASHLINLMMRVLVP